MKEFTFSAFVYERSVPMGDKLSKLSSVFRKDGIRVAAGKAARYTKRAIKKHFRLAYKSDFGKNRSTYLSLINEALKGDHDRILVWRGSFGWNVPLFQRPQHIARSLSRQNCLVFYEVTSMTDDIAAIEKYSENLYLVNFDNSYVSSLLFSAIDGSGKPKYLQFASTDWTMTREYVESFVRKGYNVLYEYIDEISSSLSGTKDIPKNIIEKYEYAMKSPDKVCIAATAEALVNDVKSKRGDANLALSTNGVDYDFFKTFDESIELDEGFKKLLNCGKYIVCYYGAMARWIDYDIIKAIAKDGRFTVVLFGVRYDDSLDKSGILQLENVRFFGPKKYGELKYYAREADVLTIPFEINDITKATSPLKLFEYMALGKPIVTTAMDECMKYGTPLIAHSREEFIGLLNEAIAKKADAEYLAALDKEALENSWDKKAGEIVSMLRNAENA